MKTSTGLSPANAPYSFRVQTTKAAVHDGSESRFRGLEYSWTAKELDSMPSSPESVEFYTGNIYPSNLDGRQENVATNTDHISTTALAKYLPTTGFQLSPEELQILARSRRACWKDIHSLKTSVRQKLRAIEALCEELGSLEEMVAERERQLAIVASIVAPIRRLPVELLTRILQFTIPAVGASFLRHPGPDSPFVLSRVCRLWRNIVLNNPSFWTRLFYDFHNDFSVKSMDDSMQKNARRSQVFQLCLERAGARPLLDLTVHDRHCREVMSFPPNFLEARLGALRLLQSQLPRCRSLFLDTYPDWHHSLLNELPPHVFSNLETLHLHSNSVLSRQRPVIPFAPSLRHYHFRSRNPLHLANIQVPHHQLETTSIQISSFNLSPFSLRDAIQAWRDFVIKCTSLRQADVQFPSSLATVQMPGLDDGTVWTFPRTQTCMEYLTRLSLEVGFEATLSTILRELDFPVIEFLHLRASISFHGAFSIAPTGHTFTEVIQHDLPFFTQLKTLCLIRVNIGNKDLRSLLCLTTQLQHLCVLRGGYVNGSWFEDSHDLVSFLTIGEAAIKNVVDFPPPLPHLQTLKLYYSPVSSRNHSLPAAYGNLARSRFSWMIRQTETNVQLPTDNQVNSPPFRMHLSVQQDIYEGIKRSIEDKLGSTYATIVRIELCGADPQEDVVEMDAPFKS